MVNIYIIETLQKFQKDLYNRLDLIINQKAFCKIAFDGYSFYKFIETLTHLVDEVRFQVTPKEILLDFTKCFYIEWRNYGVTFYKINNIMFL